MHNLSGLTVVIPTYNEHHGTLFDLETRLKMHGAEVIIVDDGSAKPYPKALCHNENKGYGWTLKTGINNASNNVILTMDGDGQHRIEDADHLYKVWQMLGNDVDMLIGARRLKKERAIRMWGRKCLNFIASLFTGIYMTDLNSGMRIFKKGIAQGYFAILCDTFSFTTSITMSYMCDDYRVEWFPIKVAERKHGSSHVRVVKHGLVTLYYILRIGLALRTRRIRKWLRDLKST